MKTAEPAANFSIYLPDSPLNTVWGLSVTSVGHACIAPHTPYPPSDAGHPEDHYFSWQQGRTLDCWQLVIIHAGTGTFESKRSGCRTLHSGHAVLLFPGIWHRYRPLLKSGWIESWIEFRGLIPQELTSQQMLQPDNCLYALRPGDIVFDHVQQCITVARDLPRGYQSHLATTTLSILSQLTTQIQTSLQKSHPIDRKIRQAQEIISRQYNRSINIADLAQKLGISEPHFRRTFKARTGFSPKQYHLECRLRHVKALMSQTSQTISEIADLTGYHSAFHLSAEFKKKYHLSPSAWRKSN
jgi:AraC-like DNA-binding protein